MHVKQTACIIKPHLPGEAVSFQKRLFAWLYNSLLSLDNLDKGDLVIREIRVRLLAQARGKVLEIGAGNGGNLAFYPPGVRLSLLDMNPYMLGYLRRRMSRKGLNRYSLIHASAECLPFPVESFDTVISVHVLCSVSDQARSLSEIRRILKPGGRFLFLEHVSAAPRTLIYRLQRIVNPVWQIIGDGCNLTRNTGEAIQEAGFREVKIDSHQVGPPSFVSPHISGVAQV